MANYKIIIPVFLFFVASILMFISFKARSTSVADNSAQTTEVAANSLTTSDATPDKKTATPTVASSSNPTQSSTTQSKATQTLPKRTKFTLPKRRTKNVTSKDASAASDVVDTSRNGPTDQETFTEESLQAFDSTVDRASTDDDSDLSDDLSVLDDLDLKTTDVDTADDIEMLEDGEIFREIEEPVTSETRQIETFSSLSKPDSETNSNDLLEDLGSDDFETFADNSEPWDADSSDIAIEPSSSTLPRTQATQTDAVRETKVAQPIVKSTSNDRLEQKKPTTLPARSSRLIAERKSESRKTTKAAATRTVDSTTKTVSSEMTASTSEPAQPSIRNSTKLPVAFLFNGRVRRLEAGQDFEFGSNSKTNRVRFDRGGSFGASSQELQAKRYEFRVSQEGWKLVPAQPNSANK